MNDVERMGSGQWTVLAQMNQTLSLSLSLSLDQEHTAETDTDHSVHTVLCCFLRILIRNILVTTITDRLLRSSQSAGLTARVLVSAFL